MSPAATEPDRRPKDDPFDLSGVVIADKYRIESLVGAGGFGVVYRGVHAGFGEPIAVKCLKLPGELDESDRRNFLARLQDEGRVLHRLSKQTSGIVQALDVGAVVTPGGQWVPYLVLEWLEGRTLARLLAERRAEGRGKLAVEEAMELLAPAADALAVAHRQKVAHRDVKPENVFVTEVDGRRTVKVLDFGIAKVLTHHASFASVATQKTASAFTPSYGAPEQFNKKRGATGPWTDVFALALLFVELVTGERALEGDDATQLYIASADPAARPTPRHHGLDLGDAVEDVLALALAVDPAERYPDAGTFWRALEEAAGRVAPAAASPPDVSDTGEFASRSGLDFESAPTEADAASSHGAATARMTEHVPSPLQREPSFAANAPAANAPAGSERLEVRSEASPDADTPVRGSKASPKAAARRGTGLPLLPFMVGLALAGAGALYWQLSNIGPSPDTRRAPPRAAATARTQGLRSTAAATASPSASAGAAAMLSASGSASSGEGGAGGASSGAPPPGMVRVATADGKASFFIDRTEVTTDAFLECVSAGRCKKAARVVLTEESARALGIPDEDAAAPEQIAAAWENRCNLPRALKGHPANCVSWGTAEDYCAFRAKRLPTSAEWSLAAGGVKPGRHPWGPATPECETTCVARNGACLSSATEVGTCSVGSHPKDAIGDGLVDFAANVSEWVSDEGAQVSSEGPRFRIVRGGSFLDELEGLDLGRARALPPVTAYVSVGFRCAADAH